MAAAATETAQNALSWEKLPVRSRIIVSLPLIIRGQKIQKKSLMILNRQFCSQVALTTDSQTENRRFLRPLVGHGQNDLVVVAGKGHENYQIFRDQTIHFDDMEVVKEAFGEDLA